MQGYLQAWRLYATFSGRSTRSEFWGFLLVHLVIMLLISFLERHFAVANPEICFGWYTALYMLVMLIPGLAITVRRLHDSGLRVWWALLLIIPLVGWLIVLLLAARGTRPAGPGHRPTDPEH